MADLSIFKMADLSIFKRGQIVGACMAGASVTKKHSIIWDCEDYYLENNDSIWERRKNLFTEVKLLKKVSAVW